MWWCFDFIFSNKVILIWQTSLMNTRRKVLQCNSVQSNQNFPVATIEMGYKSCNSHYKSAPGKSFFRNMWRMATRLDNTGLILSHIFINRLCYIWNFNNAVSIFSQLLQNVTFSISVTIAQEAHRGWKLQGRGLGG